MTDLNEMAHALKALEPPKRKTVKLDGVYVTDLELPIEASYTIANKGDTEDAPDINIESVRMLPLNDRMTDLLRELIADQVMADDVAAREAAHDPDGRGDFEYEGWKDKQMARAFDALEDLK